MERGSSLSLDKLTQLGSRGDVDMRPTLIRVLTDLYVQKLTHTPEEERHFTELALRLLDTVDVATRTAVAARLARHLAPPVQVMERLAADLPAVAEPVRGHAVLRADTKPAAPKRPSVAAAPVVGPEQQDDEARQEREARRDYEAGPVADLSAPIGAGVAAELNELFYAANAEERRLILLNLEIVAPLPADRTRPARDAAAAQKLEGAALARNHGDFAQHLAQALDIPRAQAERIAGDELGEPLVVAAKALNLPREVVYRLLLFVNNAVGHSVERVHALATLYDEMPREAAEHLVAIWQALRTAERKAGKHQPVFWNDEARVRARTASVTVQRAPSSQRLPGRRDAS
jgi:uncharacterized protein (DUF2336 family)